MAPFKAAWIAKALAAPVPASEMDLWLDPTRRAQSANWIGQVRELEVVSEPTRAAIERF